MGVEVEVGVLRLELLCEFTGQQVVNKWVCVCVCVPIDGVE